MAAAGPAYGHVQSLILGVVLAVLPGVRPRREPPVDHLLADRARLAGQPGHPVDDINDEGNRSMSLSTAMSNGVVVVPSSL